MEFLTVQETARLLRVTPITVRRYIAQGRLPAVKVGGGVRISKEAVEQLPEPVRMSDSLKKDRRRHGKPMAADDPLSRLIGIGRSDGPKRNDSRPRFPAVKIEFRPTTRCDAAELSDFLGRTSHSPRRPRRCASLSWRSRPPRTSSSVARTRHRRCHRSRCPRRYRPHPAHLD